MTRWGGKGCVVLLAGIAAVPAAAAVNPEVKAGVEAWKAGDYPTAIARWQGPAQAGNADAQFNMAQAFKLGRGVAPDVAEAIRYYRLAAGKGHQPAQASLGLLLFQSGERTGAMPWIRKAAEHGDPRAQYVLGTAYFNGDLVERDYVQAYALMSRAAASGLPQATASLAQMNGFIPADQRRAGAARAQRLPGAPAPSAASATSAPSASAATPAATAEAAPPRAVPASIPARVAPPIPATPPPRLAQRAAIATAGAWRVQFGAFGNVDGARKLWSSLRRTPAMADASPFYVPAGAVTRLQAGPFATKAAADRACAALAGQPCFSLRP